MPQLTVFATVVSGPAKIAGSREGSLACSLDQPVFETTFESPWCNVNIVVRCTPHFIQGILIIKSFSFV